MSARDRSPGPWHVAPFESGTQCVKSTDGRVVALVVRVLGEDRPRADAALIAAAPELLIELAALLPRAEAVGIDTSPARAVIARATTGGHA
jgi:hypothetical protein